MSLHFRAVWRQALLIKPMLRERREAWKAIIKHHTDAAWERATETARERSLAALWQRNVLKAGEWQG